MTPGSPMDEAKLFRARALEAIVALQQGHCDEPLHMKLDRRELDDLADTCFTFATTIAAEATERAAQIAAITYEDEGWHPFMKLAGNAIASAIRSSTGEG